jgi:hypothetical protein
VSQPLIKLGTHGNRRDVNADPSTTNLLCCVDRGAATCEGVKNDVARIAAGRDYSL